MIYFMLHGFNSATPNESSTFFEDNVLESGDRLFNLNYPFNANAAEVLIEAVEKHLEDIPMFDYVNDEFMFIGCSLGGYMAQHMAEIYLSKAIAINPAIIPSESLSRWLGINTNYRTAEVINLTEEDVEAFAGFAVNPGIVPTLVLLDMGDDVLNAEDTERYFDGKADIRTFEGGSHRFDHMNEALPAILEFANTII